MDATVTKLKLPYRTNFAVTKWDRVIHLAYFGSHVTNCNLSFVSLVDKHEVKPGGKSLCNWCFRG